MSVNLTGTADHGAGQADAKTQSASPGGYHRPVHFLLASQKRMVMLLKGPDGSFALEVLGYQFQRERGDCDNDNWLSVRISVSHPKGTWTSVDPSLQTTEVAELADWLASIETAPAIDRDLFFMEPNLSFRLTSDEQGSRQLRVYFELECRPTWAPSQTAPEEDLWLQLPVEAGQLRAAANALRGALDSYPIRGTPT